MPDSRSGPFISYSRKDVAFVRRLHDLLVARGRDPWVDWDDIPPTAEWMQSIRAGIDAAPAVFFVLSPDAIASAICAQEIEYGLAQNKRIIPIVFRPVDAALVVDAVRKLNWITPADSDTIENEADALIAVLDTDIGWVQAHARLLVRAREWREAGHDASRLLRGTDLRSYEQQLAAIGGAQTPQATPLQKQFVLASRQAQTRRQRLGLAGIGAAFVVTLALAVVAMIQSSNAERQRSVAVARLLAAQSLKQINETTGRSDVALLLGSAAVQIDPSPQTYESLAQALLATRHARKFAHTGQTLLAVATSPDGLTVATGDFYGSVTIRDAQTLQTRASSGGTGRVETVSAVAFSPDGALLATSAVGGVLLRDTGSTEVRRRLDTGSRERITQIAWSADGKTVFGSSINEELIYIWDVDSGGRRGAIPAHRHGVRDLTISVDGRTLASAGNYDPLVHLWNADSGSKRMSLEGHANEVRSLAFSHDGTLIASGGDDSLVLVHNVTNGALMHKLEGQQGKIDAIAFGADARKLATGSNNRTVFLWDLQSPTRPEVLPGHSNGLLELAFSPDGQALFSVAFEETLIAWSVDETPHWTELLAHRGEVKALAVSSDGRRVASGGEDGTIRLWSRPAGGEPARLEAHRGPVRTLSFSQDGGLLASGADRDRRVILWDVAAHLKRREIETEDEVTAVAISKDGDALATASENRESIQLWNPNTGEHRGELGGHEGHPTALVFGPDGNTLVSGGTDQAVRVWDLRAGNESGEPVGAGGTVAQLALGAAGTLLASAAHWPGDVVLRDLRLRGAPREIPTRSNSGAKTVAFSPDDRLLAFTADEFRMTIVLWDVERGQPRIELVARSTVTDLAFLPDGRQLASAHVNGRVVLWDVDIKGWPNRACAIANRNLTRDEWQIAVGDSLPYRVVCPALPVPKASDE